MRADGRGNADVREISVVPNYLEFAAGSCLFKFGRTEVLCAVSVENKVPAFLAGRGTGWLTAEYALLPASTKERTPREANTGRLTGRTQEIRRFIGRSLRPVFDLRLVGERTFIVDCDVLQADGGTRTAAVNGAFIALCLACEKLSQNNTFPGFPLCDYVAAVSLGFVQGTALLDLCYAEDSKAEVDMNLVVTGRGNIIEIGATAEKLPMTPAQFQQLVELGQQGIGKIVAVQKEILGRTFPGV